MTYYYAQIDAARIVVGVTQVAAPVEAEHMLPLDELDISILGKRHDTETGAFVDVPVAPQHHCGTSRRWPSGAASQRPSARPLSGQRWTGPNSATRNACKQQHCAPT